MKKKVLIITYYWPPSGGPGVQRALKFAKYLPQFGWEPIILTIKDGEYPAIDESLEKDIPKGCKVYKTDAFEPSDIYRKFTGMKKGEKIPVANLAQKNVSWKKKISNWIRLNLFIPDAKIGWIPYAVKQGEKIIEQEKPDIIFSTSPPPTVHLIARKLAKWSGIKWVADFRDPWTKIHYLQGQRINFLSKYRNNKLEKSVISDCDEATCVSQNFVDLLTTSDQDKFTVITNGFDIENPVGQLERNSTYFDILYIGGLTHNRYFKPFFIGLNELLEQGAIPSSKIRIRFAGSIEQSIKQDLQKIFANSEVIDFIDYLPHAQAVELMQNSELLLLFLEKVEGYEGHIPGKLFEYIATHKPILGIGNTSGETAHILRNTKTGNIFNQEDQNGIKEELIQRFTNWENNHKQEINKDAINQFSREKLTKQLVELFDKTL